MRNVMERQLSWFAILMTAFYSLLASCRGEECGHDELIRCARPLQKITSASVDLVTKQELEELCPDLQLSVKCVKSYATRCMDVERRKHFINLYSGTNMAVVELCQEGPYQENFLKHVSCMQKVKSQFDLCSKTYTANMQSIANGDHPNKIKSICCSFQDYLDCSHHAVLRKCGESTATFTKGFLDRMSSNLIRMHCQEYSLDKCKVADSAGVTSKVGGLLLTITLLVTSRYSLF